MAGKHGRENIPDWERVAYEVIVSEERDTVYVLRMVYDEASDTWDVTNALGGDHLNLTFPEDMVADMRALMKWNPEAGKHRAATVQDLRAGLTFSVWHGEEHAEPV